MQFPAAGFWQVNPGVAAELVATLKAWFAVAPTPLLVDAYAGAGVFSLANNPRPEPAQAGATPDQFTSASLLF